LSGALTVLSGENNEHPVFRFALKQARYAHEKPNRLTSAQRTWSPGSFAARF